MNTQGIGSEWAGRLIDGKYSLLQWLGGSGQGGVFLTELQDSPWPRLAIKLLPADGPDAGARLAGWMTATTLSHPNLMPLIACGRCRHGDTSLIYSVTPYSDELLSQILAERPLTPAEIEDLLKPILDALLYLHGRGFVHGHLKPSNLMVLGNQLKLSSDSLEAVGTSGAHHKPANVYDAPERDRKSITPAADVWSLGVTLVEALTQRPPGWKPSMTRAPVVPKAIPEPWAEIAKECLRRGPANRCTLSDIQIRLIPDLPPQLEAAAEAAVAPEPATEPTAEVTTESAAELTVESATEPAIESIAEPVAPAAEEPAPEQAAEPPAESAAETATKQPSESVTESAPEPASEPIAEAVTESTPETTTEPVEEAAPESATAAQPEPETEPAAEPATPAVTEPAAAFTEEPAPEPIPEFVPEPVKLPEPEPARFRINSTNAILLGVLGLFALIAVVFHGSQSTSPTPAPAKNEPQSSASSAPTATPGTVPGEVTHKVMPDVPSADNAKISGTIEVKVLVTVDPNGAIDNTILNVPGPSPSLASLAQETAQQWRFKPALVQGHPVSSFWVLEFKFSRGSTEVIPFEVSP